MVILTILWYPEYRMELQGAVQTAVASQC